MFNGTRCLRLDCAQVLTPRVKKPFRKGGNRAGRLHVQKGSLLSAKVPVGLDRMKYVTGPHGVW